MGFVYSVEIKFSAVVFTAFLVFAWSLKNASIRGECFID